MTNSLVYMVYGISALGALGVYVGLPKEGKPSRRGLMALLIGLAAGLLAMLLHPLLGSSANSILIYVLSFMSLASAVRLITHPQPLYSALYFMLVVVSTAALTIAVGATFLGAALIIVYGGAILVTYTFVIMLSQQSGPAKGLGASLNYDRAAREPLLAVISGFLLVGIIAGLIIQRPWPEWDSSVASTVTEDNTLALGQILLSDFAISMELGGLLLLVAMVGAIVIAKKRIPNLDEGERMPPGEIGKHVKPF